jgi:5-methylcytosine-specific restriction endonuclease McrA
MASGIGPHKNKWREHLFAAQEGLCHYCQRLMSLTNRTKSGYPARDFATFEHLTPRSAGGKVNSENIVLACRRCNSRANIKYQAKTACANQ